MTLSFVPLTDYNSPPEMHCRFPSSSLVRHQVSDRAFVAVALFRLAYRAGVTKAITAPTHYGFFGGLGTSFSLGAAHKLEFGAVLQETTALHVTVRHFGSTPSISTQIAALRRMLLTAASRVAADDIPVKSSGQGRVFVDVVKVSGYPPFLFTEPRYETTANVYPRATFPL